MQTNLEKAKQAINILPACEEWVDQVCTTKEFIIKQLELAAKPDWKDPAKEQPKIARSIILLISVLDFRFTETGLYLGDGRYMLSNGKRVSQDNLVAWKCEEDLEKVKF